MKITVTGRRLQISSAMREMVEKKIAKLDRFFGADTTAEVVASIEKDRHILELTIKHNDIIFRTQQTSDDIYYSLNQAVNNIERQIRRHKTRLEKRLRVGSLAEEFMQSIELEENYGVIKRKAFEVKPMELDEAIMQMELIGHEFFMFKNAQSNNICVVYKRKDGGYGLLEPND